MCRGDWKTHGSNTGGFFSCNKYDKSDAKKLDDQAGSLKAEAEKFQHFADRYAVSFECFFQICYFMYMHYRSKKRAHSRITYFRNICCFFTSLRMMLSSSPVFFSKVLTHNTSLRFPFLKLLFF